MSVSLKKPSEEVHKVDLSKPDMPGKLPECTPVHLIDEEETIKPRVSQPKQIDPVPQAVKSFDKRSHSDDKWAEEELDKLWDIYTGFTRKDTLKRILFYVVIAVSVISLVVLFVVLAVNFKLPDSQFDLLDIEPDSFFGFISFLFDYLGGNALLSIILLIVGFGVLVRILHTFMR